MNQPTDDLDARFAKLIAYRDQDNKPMTQQAMADALNAEGVPSLSGQAWSKYSVRRMLNKLKQSSGGGKRSGTRSAGSRTTALSDDEIRARIRQGRYDTEQERFVSLPAAASVKNKKKKGKKDKKDKKNKKKK